MESLGKELFGGDVRYYGTIFRLVEIMGNTNTSVKTSEGLIYVEEYEVTGKCGLGRECGLYKQSCSCQ